MGYSVGPMVLWIFWMYWVRLTIVAKSGGYYSPPFKGCHGITKGDTISPTIFNVVVGAVIICWVTVVEATEVGTEGLGTSVQYLVSYFYTDNGIVTSTQPKRLQREFNDLTDLFYQVIIHTSTCKTVIIACHPCHMPCRMSVVDYDRRSTGV